MQWNHGKPGSRNAHICRVIIAGRFDAVESCRDSSTSTRAMSPPILPFTVWQLSETRIIARRWCGASPAKIGGDIGNRIVNVRAVPDRELAYDPGYPITIRRKVAEFQ